MHAWSAGGGVEARKREKGLKLERQDAWFEQTSYIGPRGELWG